MFTRYLHALLTTSLLMACSPATVCATDAPVFLRGFEVTPEHIVFGGVDRVAGGAATINLGFAHGVRPGNVFLVVRPAGDDVIPVSGLTVRESYPNHSVAQVEGPFRVAPGDFLLIPASQLDLWAPVPRAEQLIQKHLARKQLANGYDTFDLNPALADEVARDDEFQRRMRGVSDVRQFVGEALRKTDPHTSRAGAVIPTPILSSNEQAQQKTSDDPTVVGLTRFVERVKTPDVLRSQLTLALLSRLTPLDDAVQVSEETESVFRQVLLAWTARVLPFKAPPAPPPAETPEEPAVSGATGT